MDATNNNPTTNRILYTIHAAGSLVEGTEKDDDDDGDDVVDGDNVGVMIVATKYPEKIGPKPRPRASPVPTMAFIEARSVIFVMEAFIPIVV